MKREREHFLRQENKLPCEEQCSTSRRLDIQSKAYTKFGNKHDFNNPVLSFMKTQHQQATFLVTLLGPKNNNVKLSTKSFPITAAHTRYTVLTFPTYSLPWRNMSTREGSHRSWMKTSNICVLESADRNCRGHKGKEARGTARHKGQTSAKHVMESRSYICHTLLEWNCTSYLTSISQELRVPGTQRTVFMPSHTVSGIHKVLGSLENTLACLTPFLPWNGICRMVGDQCHDTLFV